ncbi:MAG: thioredoxin family protein [Thermomicrobiales bacterium]
MDAREYWGQGLSYDQYLAQMTIRSDEYRENFASTDIDNETIQVFSGRDLRFLVITEDWCGDSSQFVPAVARLASQLDNAEIRFLLRPDVRELADQYRDGSGRQPIPVIIVMDENGTELGALLERPGAVTEQMAAETIRFASENSHLEGIRRSYANMPEETKSAVSDNISTWRSARQEEFVRLLFEELASILRAPATA